MADNGTATPPGSPPDPYAYHGFVVPPHVGRRLAAAAVDVAVVGTCCLGLFLAYNPFVESARLPGLGPPAAAVLVAAAGAELLTGITPGKWLAGLAVRLPDGSRPPVWRLVLRGAVRLLPVGVFLPCLLTPDPFTNLTVWGFNFTLVSCYVPGCYIPLMRTGRTLFDHAAGTVVVPAGRGSARGS